MVVKWVTLPQKSRLGVDFKAFIKKYIGLAINKANQLGQYLSYGKAYTNIYNTLKNGEHHIDVYKRQKEMGAKTLIDTLTTDEDKSIALAVVVALLLDMDISEEEILNATHNSMLD